MRLRLQVGLLLSVAGCAASPPAPEGIQPNVGIGTQPAATVADNLPPAGLGTLRQDQFTVEMRSGAVQLRVTPLQEWVLRLAAPDTYRRLHGIVSAHRDVRSRNPALAGSEPTWFLVSFFSRDAGQEFHPHDLLLESAGREFRPSEVIPLTPAWGEQRLQQQQPETALYQFDHPIDLNLPLVIRYGVATSHRWQQIIPILQAEQARVMTRAASQPIP
jgi:hypothetical protein